MAVKFDSEKELAQAVVDHLEREGWETWFEVQPNPRGPIADIVAIHEETLLVVECKTSFGARLVSDGMNWIGWADRIALAYPQREFSDRRIQRSYLSLAGIYDLELWTVGKEYHRFNRGKSRRVVENKRGARPHDEPPLKIHLMEFLRDEHKDWADPGSKNANHVTSFKITCRNLIEYVKKHKGCTLKEAVKKIGHHYQHDESAISSLGRYIKKGIVKGIRNEGSGRYMKLYPDNS